MAKKTEKELEIQRLDKKTPLQMLWDYVMITVASFVYAVSVSLFLDPNSLAPGGITGIAIILNRLFGIETGTWMLLINIPILLIGIWKFGLRFILSTIYCTAMTSLFTNLLTPVGAVTTDPLLASLTGSALMAVSMGWVILLTVIQLFMVIIWNMVLCLEMLLNLKMMIIFRSTRQEHCFS